MVFQCYLVSEMLKERKMHLGKKFKLGSVKKYILVRTDDWQSSEGGNHARKMCSTTGTGYYNFQASQMSFFGVLEHAIWGSTMFLLHRFNKHHNCLKITYL